MAASTEASEQAPSAAAIQPNANSVQSLRSMIEASSNMPKMANACAAKPGTTLGKAVLRAWSRSAESTSEPDSTSTPVAETTEKVTSCASCCHQPS